MTTSSNYASATSSGLRMRFKRSAIGTFCGRLVEAVQIFRLYRNAAHGRRYCIWLAIGIAFKGWPF